MKKNNDTLSGILFLLCSLIIFSNIKVFISYVEQQKIVADLKQYPPKLSLSEAESFNYNYPTLNVFTLPLKHYLGRVYLREGKYDMAAEQFHKARAENPYLLANENFLTEVYRNLKIDDSVEYYANLTFQKMPNNIMHFENYLLTLSTADSTKIEDAFEKIIHKREKIWVAYLTKTLQLGYKYETLNKNINIAKEKYPKSPLIRLLVDYHLIGKEKIDNSILLIEEGIKYMEKQKFIEATVFFEEAYNINPQNIDLLENLTSCYYLTKKYKKALEIVEQINEELVNNLGRFYFIKGLTYVENGLIDKGCNLFTQSIKQNYNEAYKAKLKYCGK